MKTHQQIEQAEIEKFPKPKDESDPKFENWLSDFEKFKRDLQKTNPQLQIRFFPKTKPLSSEEIEKLKNP